MPVVEIEYCVPCGRREAAEELQRELLDRFGASLDGVRITTKEDGDLAVYLGGTVVWTAADHEGPVPTEAVARAVGDHLGAPA